MRVEEQFYVLAAPELMFRELNDVGGIGQCIAGVKRVEVLSDDESRWKLEVRAGFVAMNVELDARITERRPHDLLRFVASGQDVEIDGRVDLAANGSGTNCRVLIDATIGGALGPLAERVARGPQEQLVATTIENIRQRLEAASGVASAVLNEAASISGPGDDAGTGRAVPGRPNLGFRLPESGVGMLLTGGLLVLLGYLLGRSRSHRG